MPSTDLVQMVHCWKCGAQLRDGAQFCDSCGASMRNAPYGRAAQSDGDIYRSTRYFVGATRVNAAVSAVIGGFMFLGISLLIPSWAGGMSGLVALMGLGLILTGAAYWFLSQD